MAPRPKDTPPKDIPHKDIPIDRLDRLAWFLDNSIKIPGINYRIGLDGIIGLIPGIGDAAGTLLSMYILSEAAQAKLPRSVLMRMGWNIAVDTVIGAIPVVGDIFDVTWKANARNVRLIKEYRHATRQTTRQSRWVMVGIIAALILVIALITVGAVVLLRLAWISIHN